MIYPLTLIAYYHKAQICSSNNKPKYLYCWTKYIFHSLFWTLYLFSCFKLCENLRLVCIDVYFPLHTPFKETTQELLSFSGDLDSKTILSAYNNMLTISMPAFTSQFSMLLTMPLMNKLKSKGDRDPLGSPRFNIKKSV